MGEVESAFKELLDPRSDALELGFFLRGVLSREGDEVYILERKNDAPLRLEGVLVFMLQLADLFLACNHH